MMHAFITHYLVLIKGAHTIYAQYARAYSFVSLAGQTFPAKLPFCQAIIASLPPAMILVNASEIDAILTAEVPDLGLFSIAKFRNSAATQDRLREKILKSRFVPSKTWVAAKRQCGQKKRCVSADFFNKEMYPCIHYSVTRDAL